VNHVPCSSVTFIAHAKLSPPDLRLDLTSARPFGQLQRAMSRAVLPGGSSSQHQYAAPSAMSVPGILDDFFCDGGNTQRRLLSPTVALPRRKPSQRSRRELVAPGLWLFLGPSLALLVSLSNEQTLENNSLIWWAVLGLNQ
jgi:hypothetical protein